MNSEFLKNLYAYYLTHIFFGSARNFNLLTLGFELVTREFEIITRKFELITRAFELVTHRFELVTRVLLFHVFFLLLT